METDDDEDTDTQGVGLSLRRGSRFVSDSLTFTGTDLGDRHGSLRRRYQDSESDEDGSSTDVEEDEDGLGMLDPQDREEILVQNAMARIQRAQAKGRTDVSLSKDELEALERRKRRLAEEAEKKERRRRREQRIAVPLTQLEPVSRKKKSGRSSELSSRHPSASDLTQVQDRQNLPPMGHFPPPAGTRTRPRSGTASSQRPSSHGHDEQGSPQLAYDYVQRPPSVINNRHVSDSMARPRSSRSHYGDDANSYYGGGGGEAHDPFQFQTAGPRAPSSAGAGAASASRRHASGSSEVVHKSRPEAGASAATRSTRGHRRSTYYESSDEEFVPSDDGSGSVSDDLGNGARIREVPRGRGSAIVVEESPEPDRGSPKKKEPSPAKRKPVASRGKKKKK